MIRVAYNCKICGQAGHATYDQSAPINDLTKWVSMLTCNRCYDFRSRFMHLSAVIAKHAHELEVTRLTVRDERRRRDMEAAIRGLLVTGTKKIATIVCDHYRTANIWDQEFAELIFDRPEKVWRILHDYRNHINNMKTQETAPCLGK